MPDAEWMRKYRQTDSGKRGIDRQKRRDRAKGKAFRQLAQMYPEDFSRLLAAALSEEGL
jgi:hypothetical protein